MVRVFVNKENSGWIFDRIHADYVKTTRHKVVGLNERPDICWFLNPWEFSRYAYSLFCPSFVHVHHIDETKISAWPFDIINRFATGCIVPCKHTEEVLKKYVDIPIYCFPYWLISDMTAPLHEFKKGEEILIGSFQKDSEGKTNKPKLSKGPDIFLELLSELKESNDLKVILAGYNRGYMIDGLKRIGIPFEYHERVSDINSLYDRLDWYFITSRVEGGPQAVLEASYRRVKILSTDVGIAPEVLHPDCICKNVNEFVTKFDDMVDRRDYNYNNVVINFGCSLIVDRLDEFFEKKGSNNE
ncbi:MAG: glycosyltransferase [Synergistaceae bacterium]